MKYELYITTNEANGVVYAGAHCCDCNPCEYLGSGLALQQAVQDYGSECFTREVIQTYDTYEELMEAEANLVDLDWVESPNTYNLRTGGLKGTFCEVSKKRISEANIGGKKVRISLQVSPPFDASKMKEPKKVKNSRIREMLKNSALYAFYARRRKAKRDKKLAEDRARLFGGS